MEQKKEYENLYLRTVERRISHDLELRLLQQLVLTEIND